MSTRKIGPHIIGGFSGAVGKPLAVKLVNPSVEYVRQMRAELGPRCLIVVRWVEDARDLTNPEQAARAWYDRWAPQMRAMAGSPPDQRLAFEGLNEVPDEQATLYARFELARLALMQKAGYCSVVGNFSAGTPDLPVWEKYRPVIRALAPGDWLGLHEYWVDSADLSNPYHVGRWRKVPMLAAVPILVTECGRDVIEGRGKAGWRASCSEGEFLSDLHTYNDLLEQHPNVAAALVFTVGMITAGLEAFDCNSLWSRVVAGYPTPMEPAQPAADVQAPGVRYLDQRSLLFPKGSRGGQAVRYLIVSDSGAPREDALARWLGALGGTRYSAHDLIDAQGLVRHCVTYADAACHAADLRLSGVSNLDALSIGVSLEYPAAPATPAWPKAQLDAAVAHLRMLAATYRIPRSNVYAASALDPQRRGGPRNLDWNALLNRVFPDEEDRLTLALRRSAWMASGIPYNPEAAFPRHARANNLGNPETPEFEFAYQGTRYRGQGYSKGIVYAPVGQWDQIQVALW
ncbi:MAG: N-acetylmuramoyl-L-alanine amidase [Anaerolineae bacterium]